MQKAFVYVDSKFSDLVTGQTSRWHNALHLQVAKAPDAAASSGDKICQDLMGQHSILTKQEFHIYCERKIAPFNVKGEFNL